MALRPPIPAAYRQQDPETGEDLPALFAKYDPSSDPQLATWIEIVEQVSDMLNLGRGTIKDPDAGRYGLVGLTDPRIVHFAWPSKSEIMSFEACLIDETLKRQLKYGVIGAQQWLLREFNIPSREAQGLTQMASYTARARVVQDLDTNRAEMILRLEDYLRRCRRAYSLKGEIQGLKVLAIVQGLGKGETDDVLKNFTQVVREATGGTRRIQAAPVPSHILLPPPAQGR
jgi:hypothetical protein